MYIWLNQRKQERREQEAESRGRQRAIARRSTQPNTFTATLNVNGPKNQSQSAGPGKRAGHAQAAYKRDAPSEKTQTGWRTAEGLTLKPWARDLCATTFISGRADFRRGDIIGVERLVSYWKQETFIKTLNNGNQNLMCMPLTPDLQNKWGKNGQNARAKKTAPRLTPRLSNW